MGHFSMITVVIKWYTFILSNILQVNRTQSALDLVLSLTLVAHCFPTGRTCRLRNWRFLLLTFQNYLSHLFSHRFAHLENDVLNLRKGRSRRVFVPVQELFDKFFRLCHQRGFLLAA